MRAFSVLTFAFVTTIGSSLGVTWEGRKLAGFFNTPDKRLANTADGRQNVKASGNDVPPQPHEYPFLASIQIHNQNGWYHQCAGSIISTGTILTTQYCSSLCYYYRCRIVVGVRDAWESSAIIYSVDCSDQHPKFDGSLLNYDYGVLYTTEPIVLVTGKVQILELPKNSSVISTTNCVSPGWGLDESQGKLQSVKMTVYPRESCQEVYNDLFMDRMICGFDSKIPYQLLEFGAPLLCDGILTGIGSWAYPPSGSPNFPAVFSDTTQELGWIESKVNGSCHQTPVL